MINFFKNSFILFLFVGVLCKNTNAQGFSNYKQGVNNETFLFEMIAVSGGEFLMGANANDTSRKKDEKPSHKVQVDDFWMGKYEVTWEQYDAFVFGKFTPSQFKKPSELQELGIDGVTGATTPYVEMSFGMGKGNFPAINMTQYAAIMYCKWLTSKTGIFYRLPTEAEWEYVCKKGKTDAVPNIAKVAWFKRNSRKAYKKTGTKLPNNLGVHDLLGNVSEWVLDQYSETYYANSPKRNPWNVPSNLYPRVTRGGSWKDTADKLCCTYRKASNAKWKQRDPQIPKSDWWFTDASFVGFRIVRPKIQPSKKEIKKYWIEAITDYGIN